MRWRAGLLLLCGCAGTTWQKVADTDSIEDARAELGSYAPDVVHYGKNAEAWYFGQTHCVLFVDGKKVKVRSMRQQVNEVHDTPYFKPQRVDCAP